MLRPKKKITKKEIQRDPFLESVDRAQAHLEDNRKKYLNVGIILLIVLIGYNVVSSKQSQQNLKASSSLGEALAVLDKGDKTTAQFQFETVVNDYDGTNSASFAEYYLGKIQFDAGNFIDAEIYLRNYLKNEPKGFLSTPAVLMLSDILSTSEQIENAIVILNRGIKNSSTDTDIRTLNLYKAKLELKSGNTATCKQIVEDILSIEDLNVFHKEFAQELLGKLLS